MGTPLAHWLSLVNAGATANDIVAFFAKQESVNKEGKRKQRDEEAAQRELAKAVRCPKLEKPPVDHFELLVYLRGVNRYIDIHKPTDELLLSTLLGGMKGKPYEKIDTLSTTLNREQGRPPTWTEIEKALLDAFGSLKTPHEDNRRALYRCYWKTGTLAEFVSTFRFIYERVISDGPLPDVFAIDYFLKGIRSHSDVYEKLRLDSTTVKPWETLAPLLERAEVAYGNLVAKEDAKKQKTDKQGTHSDTKGKGRFTNTTDGGRSGYGRGRDRFSAHDRGRGRFDARVPLYVGDQSGGSGSSGSGFGYQGNRGGRFGNRGGRFGNRGGRHDGGGGRQHQPATRTHLTDAAKQWLVQNNRCFKCTRDGHTLRDCPNPPSLEHLPGNLKAYCRIGS